MASHHFDSHAAFVRALGDHDGFHAETGYIVRRKTVSSGLMPFMPFDADSGSRAPHPFGLGDVVLGVASLVTRAFFAPRREPPVAGEITEAAWRMTGQSIQTAIDQAAVEQGTREHDRAA